MAPAPIGRPVTTAPPSERLHIRQLRQPHGQGDAQGVARYEGFRDRFRHVLRCDIYRYFPAVDHAVLKRNLRRRLACGRTSALADGINAHVPLRKRNLINPNRERAGDRHTMLGILVVIPAPLTPKSPS